jgi:hypothetical protein
MNETGVSLITPRPCWGGVCFRFTWCGQVSFVLFAAVHLRSSLNLTYNSQCPQLDVSHCAGLPLRSDSGSVRDIHLPPRWSPSCWHIIVILSNDARRIC